MSRGRVCAGGITASIRPNGTGLLLSAGAGDNITVTDTGGMTAADLPVDEAELGLAGSPTQVYKVNYVVLETTESKEVQATLEGIREMIQELVQEYIVG